jgi:hypothetical protein
MEEERDGEEEEDVLDGAESIEKLEQASMGSAGTTGQRLCTGRTDPKLDVRKSNDLTSPFDALTVRIEF